ncbi:ser thr phosphatase family protein, partial [Cystoisospora suis]
MLPQQYPVAYLPLAPQWGKTPGVSLEGTGERKDKSAGEAFTDRSSSQDPAPVQQENLRTESRSPSSSVRGSEFTAASQWGASPSVPQAQHWNTPMQQRTSDPSVAVAPAAVRGENAQIGPTAAPYRQNASSQNGEDEQASAVPLPRAPDVVVPTYTVQNRDNASSPATPTDDTRPAPVQAAPAVRPASDHTSSPPAANSVTAQDTRQKQPSSQHPYADSDRRQKEIYDSGRVTQTSGPPASPSWQMPTSSVSTPPEAFQAAPSSQGIEVPHQHQEAGHSDTYQDRPNTWFDDRLSAPVSPQQNMQSAPQNESPPPEKIQQQRTVYESFQTAPPEPPNTFQNPPNFPGMIPQAGGVDGRGSLPSSFAWNPQQGQNALDVPSSPVMSPYFPTVSPAVGFFPPPSYPQSPLTAGAMWHPTMMNTLPRLTSHQPSAALPFLPVPPEGLPGTVAGVSLDPGHSVYPYAHFPFNFRPTPTPLPSYSAPWMMPTFHPNGNSSPWLQVFNIHMSPPPLPSSPDNAWTSAALSPPGGEDNRHDGKLQQEAEDARTRIIQKKDRGKSIQEEKSASARGARAIEHADKRGFRDETDSSQDDSNTVEEDSTDRHWNSPGPRSSRSPAFIEVRNEAMILERELQGTSLDEVHPALRGGPERDMPVGAFYHFQGRDGRMQDSKKFSHPRGPNYPERTSNHGTKWSPGGTGGRNPPHRSFDQDDDSDELIAYRPYKSHRNRETNYDDPNTLHSRPRDPPFRESPGIKFANPTRRTRGEEREFSRPFRPSVSLPSNDILENLFGSLYTETTRRSTLGTLCAEETFRIAWLTDLEVDPGYSSRASVKMSCRDPDRGKTHHNPGTDEVSPSTPEQGQQPHGLSRSDAAHVPDKASSTSPFTNTTTAATTTENLTSSFINSHHDTPLTYQRSSSNSEERHRGEQPSASIVERITTTERVPPGTPAALTSTDSSKEIEERVGLNADENALPFGDPSQGSSSETRGLGQRDGGESTDNQTIEKNQGDDPHESNGHKDDIMNTNRSSNSRQEKEGNIRKPEDLTEEEKVDEVSPATAVLGRPGCDAPLVLLDKALDDIQTLADISSTLEGLLLTQQREEDEAPTSEEVDGTSFSPWEHDRWREWAGKNERQEPRLWPEEFHDTDSYRVPSNQDSKDLILRYLKARSHLYNPPHNPTLVEEVQNKTQVPQPLHFEKESVPLTDNLQDAFEKTTPSFIDESPGTAHYVLRPLRLSKGSLESKNEQTSHPFRGHPEISSSQPNEKGEEELRWSSVKYLWSILENIERAPHQVLPSQVSPLPVVVQLPSGFLWEQMQTIERQESLSPDIQTTRDGQRLVVVPTLQPFYRPTQDRKVDTPPPPPGVWTILHDDLLLQQHRSQTFLRVMLLLMALRRRYGHVSRTPVVVFPDEARSTARKTEEDFLNESSHTDGTVRTQENQTTGSSELLVATSQPERVHGGAALVEEGQAEKEKHRETRRLGRKTVIGSTVLKGYRDETGTEEKMEWDEDEEDLEMPYVRRREYGKGYYAEREREDAFTEGGRRREEEDEEEEKMRLFTKKEKDETDQLLCIAQTPVEAILVSGDFVGKTPSYNDEERWKALSEATKRLYQRFLFFSPSPTSTSSTLSEMSHHASPDLPHKEGKDTAFSSDAQPESNLQRSSTNDQQPGGHHSTLTEEQEENDIGRYQEIRRATSKKGQSSSLLPEKKTRSGVTGETSPSKHMASMQLIFVVGEKDIPLERGQGGGLSLPSLSWRKKLYELWKPILPGDEANRKTFLRGLYYRTELRKRPGVIFLVLNSLLYSPSASSDRSSFPFSPPRRCRVSVASPGASSRYSSESISNTPTTTSVNNTCADDGIEGVGDIRKESSPAFSSSEESGRDTFISDDESDP